MKKYIILFLLISFSAISEEKKQDDDNSKEYQKELDQALYLMNIGYKESGYLLLEKLSHTYEILPLDTYIIMGDYAIEVGLIERGINHLKKYLELSSKEEHWNRAWAYILIGQKEKALSEALMYSKKNSKNISPLHEINLGLYFLLNSNQNRSTFSYLIGLSSSKYLDSSYFIAINDLKKIQKLSFYKDSINDIDNMISYLNTLKEWQKEDF